MTGARDDGGAAFPLTPENTVRMDGSGGRGMTLRDYFAAKAMQAAIGTAAAPFMFRDVSLEPYIAEMAYGVADAMLKARAA